MFFKVYVSGFLPARMERQRTSETVLPISFHGNWPPGGRGDWRRRRKLEGLQGGGGWDVAAPSAEASEESWKRSGFLKTVCVCVCLEI